ncbi:BON domain-containing protein [Novipirellula artificiosorum]|uniref:BON domain protein n=1 Tax=Novipirellula artificiosorum TaxID=2528016 RepID=A0A5C6DSY9_9BACT|nr:BON domain-containing protein [Novipirellula artificiosorum]TWU39415.1 BON domain protein [Novipirellula artificiosorum]
MNENTIEQRLIKTLVRFGFPHLQVAVDSQGVAELIGSVATSDDRAFVASIASTTPGVTSVKNQLRVAKP